MNKVVDDEDFATGFFVTALFLVVLCFDDLVGKFGPMLTFICIALIPAFFFLYRWLSWKIKKEAKELELRERELEIRERELGIKEGGN